MRAIMADKIRAFFKQKKAEAKFKSLSGGKKLGDAPPPQPKASGRQQVSR